MATRFNIQHIVIIFEDDQPHDMKEAMKYWLHAANACPQAREVRISFEDDPDGEPQSVALLNYSIIQPFERIRRITGYLNKTDRFNHAKQAEEHDRVTHGLENGNTNELPGGRKS